MFQSPMKKRGQDKDAATKEKRRIAAIFENFPDAIVIRHSGGEIFYFNRKAEELFRVERDALIGRRPGDLNDPKMLEMRTALSLDIPVDGEARFAMPTGDHVRAFIVRHIIVTLGDEDPLSLWSFRETTKEEELSRLKTEFMSVAAHQLRTPSAAIKWVMEMLLKGEVGALSREQRDLLTRVAQAVDRMIRLIADLLDVTRIEEGRLSYTFQTELALADVVKRITETFYERAAAKNLTLTFQGPKETLPPLRIDPNRFSLAVENAIANSLNYTFQGGVQVQVERRGDVVAIVVRDTGMGIPKSSQQKLFSKFYRGENVARQGIEGTGLGLFIMRSIIRRHGGDVTVESEEGKGTTVTLLLPVDPAKVPTGEMSIGEMTV